MGILKNKGTAFSLVGLFRENGENLYEMEAFWGREQARKALKKAIKRIKRKNKEVTVAYESDDAVTLIDNKGNSYKYHIKECEIL